MKQTSSLDDIHTQVFLSFVIQCFQVTKWQSVVAVYNQNRGEKLMSNTERLLLKLIFVFYRLGL